MPVSTRVYTNGLSALAEAASMLPRIDAHPPESPQAERKHSKRAKFDQVLPKIRVNSLTAPASLDSFEKASDSSAKGSAGTKRFGGYEEYTFVEADENVVYKDWTDSELGDWEITKERQWFFHQEANPRKFAGLDDKEPKARAASMKNKYTACGEDVRLCEAPRMLAVEKSGCCTGQEYFPAQEQSRPIVSDHFGRKGSNFSQIPKKYRVLWCRKCDQHVRDRLMNHFGRRDYALVQLEVIAQQIRKLEIWAPRGRYCIGLQVSFRTKYEQFRSRRTSITDREAAQFVNDVRKMDSQHCNRMEHQNMIVINDDSRWFPVEMAEELLSYCSMNSTTYDKTSGDVLALVSICRKWLLEGRCEVVAPVEFLLAEQAAKQPVAKRRSPRSVSEAPAQAERDGAPKKRKRSG
ncbi:hypothetical protein MBLNU457_1421t2 [Dothideomycetes sp. NU457]